MLHPDPQREWFGFNRDSFPVEQFKNVACGVTCGQEASLCGDRVSFLCPYRRKPRRTSLKVGYPGVEMYLAATRKDRFPNLLNDGRELVRTNVWMRIKQNLCTGSM